MGEEDPRIHCLHRTVKEGLGKAYLAAGRANDAIAPLRISEEWDDVASSVVRQRLDQGEDWEHWIPISIADRVRQIYGRKR